MTYKYDVFISYSRKDTEIADNIVRVFKDAGITCFIDRQGIGGGMEFPAVLAKAIRESQVFLFLASENSYSSKFTQSEIVYAFNKKAKQDIIPYIIDKSTMPEELEFTFSAINWRRMEEHPIDTVLVEDVLRKIGKTRLLKENGTEDTPKERQTEKIKDKKFFHRLDLLMTGENLAKTVMGAAITVFVVSILLSLLSDSFIHENFSFFSNALLIFLFAFFIALLVGLIRPASMCLHSRKEVAKYYLSSLVIVFVTFCVIQEFAPLMDMDNLPDGDNTNKIDSLCKAIDLGMPSGTLWGDRNVGAKAPVDFGNLYAWGEIKTKEDYSLYSYVEQLKPTKITSAKYDAATTELGGEWVMPTEEQYKELLSECSWYWKNKNGHNGYEIVGRNGNSIFLPASGWSRDTTVEYRNQYGYYWTSERSSNPRYARSLQFPKDGKGIVGNGDLHVGRSVRAVFLCDAVAE